MRPTILCYPKRHSGVKFATPIYKDEKGVKLLVAENLGLQGKPDYIFQRWITGSYIPLEIKSGHLKEDEPHEGDLFQLVTYFLLIEEVYGKRPPYGKLVYANKTFKVRNTFRLRKELERTIQRMRNLLETGHCKEAEPSFAKCRHCMCRMTVCEYTKED